MIRTNPITINAFSTSEDLMANTIITKEMKRRCAIVSIKAKHRNLEIAGFLKDVRSFVCKVRKAKGLLKKSKYSEEEECLRFFFDEKHFHQDEKVNRRNDWWVAVLGVDLTEVPTVMHAHEVSKKQQ
ncbi:hypothetical protein ACTXT7_017610 [Hymenolepis weldensis]